MTQLSSSAPQSWDLLTRQVWPLALMLCADRVPTVPSANDAIERDPRSQRNVAMGYFRTHAVQSKEHIHSITSLALD